VPLPRPAKDDDGNSSQVAVGDDEDLGALLGSVVPLGVATASGSSDRDGGTGFNRDDALALADALRPGTALAFVLVERAWAQRLFEAIADTGGELVGERFLTADLGLIVGAEVAAVEEAAAVIAAAQTAAVNATLDVIRAQARAAEAIAESEAIRAAAAADAVQALIDAGVVAQAAAQEALDAVRAAGLITAAADEAAAAAVAQDTIAMAAAVPEHHRARPRPPQVRRRQEDRDRQCRLAPIGTKPKRAIGGRYPHSSGALRQ